MEIILCLNRRHFVGALAAVRSIVSNAAHPQALSFHFTVHTGESPELLALIQRCFPQPVFRYGVQEFRPSAFLETYIQAGQHLTYATHDSQVMNFSRFYLDDLYPELDRMIYLDSDLIVQGDIAELGRIASLERHTIAATPFASFRSWEGGFKEDSAWLRHIDFADPVFNVGVYVTSLETWRKRGIRSRMEDWMQRHMGSFQEFVFGTQSLMNIALYREFQQLPREWNLVPLGLDTSVPERTLEEAKILHWAGDKKPWTANGLYKAYWRKYAFDL